MSPTVTKGRITIPGRMEHRNFLINPHEIEASKTTGWEVGQLPGASHPIYQYGAGGERTWSLTLYLDAIQNRIFYNGQLDLTYEINWYRSLGYPVVGSTAESVAPPVVLFTFGLMFQTTPCVVKSVKETLNYFSPDLRILRAKIDLTMGEAPPWGQVRDNLLPPDMEIEL